jgi:hypothetical protein
MGQNPSLRAITKVKRWGNFSALFCGDFAATLRRSPKTTKKGWKSSTLNKPHIKEISV